MTDSLLFFFLIFVCLLAINDRKKKQIVYSVLLIIWHITRGINNKMYILFCLLKLIRNRLDITPIICFLFSRNINLPITNKNMDYIYHGCPLKRFKWYKCNDWIQWKVFYPTSKCFQKNPTDITNAVKTRFQLKKQPIAR